MTQELDYEVLEEQAWIRATDDASYMYPMYSDEFYDTQVQLAKMYYKQYTLRNYH